MLPEQDNPRAIHDLLLGMPTHDRLAALMCAIIEDANDPVLAVANTISFAGIMMRCLLPHQRLALVWLMLEEIEKTSAKWN